jgi:hypothetical protein
MLTFLSCLHMELFDKSFLTDPSITACGGSGDGAAAAVDGGGAAAAGVGVTVGRFVVFSAVARSIV